jgi:fused-like protein
MEGYLQVHKFVTQVLAVLMHPIYGEIFSFPWKRSQSNGTSQKPNK